MEVYSNTITVLVFLFSFLTIFSQHFTLSATVVVDGVSQWNNPTVQVGDSIIFRHKYNNYNLYIFRNRRAFNMCNFTEATLLTKSNTTFTWHPSRLGSFYFAFNNGSAKACEDGHKLAIQVSSTMPTPPDNYASPPGPQPKMPAAEAPSPTINGDGGNIVSSSPSPTGFGGGNIISSSPSYPWPNRPQESDSPSLSPMNAIFPSSGPEGAPRKGGSSIPFINSNPAVPLPTGEVDSATIRPFSSSGDHTMQVTVLRAFCCVAFLVLFL